MGEIGGRGEMNSSSDNFRGSAVENLIKKRGGAKSIPLARDSVSEIFKIHDINFQFTLDKVEQIVLFIAPSMSVVIYAFKLESPLSNNEIIYSLYSEAENFGYQESNVVQDERFFIPGYSLLGKYHNNGIVYNFRETIISHKDTLICTVETNYNGHLSEIIEQIFKLFLKVG